MCASQEPSRCCRPSVGRSSAGSWSCPRYRRDGGTMSRRSPSARSPASGASTGFQSASSDASRRCRGGTRSISGASARHCTMGRDPTSSISTVNRKVSCSRRPCIVRPCCSTTSIASAGSAGQAGVTEGTDGCFDPSTDCSRARRLLGAIARVLGPGRRWDDRPIQRREHGTVQTRPCWWAGAASADRRRRTCGPLRRAGESAEGHRPAHREHLSPPATGWRGHARRRRADR